MLRKTLAAAVLALATVTLTAGVASAHATLVDRVMTANSYAVFTVRVPNEKDNPTTQVRVDVPAGFTVTRVKPLPGFTYSTELNDDGQTLRSITWSGQIGVREFMDFQFQGRTAAEPGRYAFPVYQTYQDGETVNWTGPSDAPTPAAQLELTAAGAVTDAHGHTHGAGPDNQGGDGTHHGEPEVGGTAGDTHAHNGGNAMGTLTTVAAFGGLAMGAAALALSLRRK